MSITPWSFSRIKTFEQCPRKFYHLKVACDYEEPETEAMLYGTLFHEACEKYVRDGADLDPRFAFAKPVLDALLRKPGDKLCEYKMGLTENLEPCDFDAEDVWWRGIADLLIVNGAEAFSIDYKTGRNLRYADTGQLELIALGMFKHFPAVQTVRSGLLYPVANALVRETYRREDEPQLWQKWLTHRARMVKVAEADVWNPNPSGLCKRHCIVTSCPHNGRHS